jgi:hypothetical protein
MMEEGKKKKKKKKVVGILINLKLFYYKFV